MDLQVVTPQDGLTIDAALVRENMRVSNAAEDTLIQGFIEAAEDWVRTECNRPLLPTTYRLTFDQVYPVFALPRPPFISFVSLAYQIEGQDAVMVDTTGMKPRYQRMLPTFSIEALEGKPAQAGTMAIEWSAGFANPASVPPRVRQAIIQLASHWFQHRTAAQMDPRLMDVVKEVPFGVRDLLKGWRIPNVNDEQLDRY